MGICLQVMVIRKVGNSNEEEVLQSRPRGKGMDTDSGKKKKIDLFLGFRCCR